MPSFFHTLKETSDLDDVCVIHRNIMLSIHLMSKESLELHNIMQPVYNQSSLYHKSWNLEQLTLIYLIDSAFLKVHAVHIF